MNFVGQLFENAILNSKLGLFILLLCWLVSNKTLCSSMADMAGIHPAVYGQHLVNHQKARVVAVLVISISLCSQHSSANQVFRAFYFETLYI